MLGDEFRKVPGSQITYTLVDWCEGFSLGEVTGRFWVERQSLTFGGGKVILQLCWMKWSEVTQLCPTLCNPMDCGLPGSSSQGIFQARILEWVAISFSRGSSQPRDRTWVSHTASRLFTVSATRKAMLRRDCKRARQKQEDQFKGCWNTPGERCWWLTPGKEQQKHWEE